MAATVCWVRLQTVLAGAFEQDHVGAGGQCGDGGVLEGVAGGAEGAG
jgi:hypothetical protein